MGSYFWCLDDHVVLLYTSSGNSLGTGTREKGKEVGMKESCNSCDQMKRENTAMRKAITDTNANYVEVVNENLALRRKIEELTTLADNLFPRRLV